MTKLNKMAAPTWNRLDLNDISVRLPEFSCSPKPCGDESITALGSELCGLIGNVSQYTKSGCISLEPDGESKGVILHAAKGSELTMTMYVTSSGQSALRTFAEVSDNAVIRLVQVIEAGADGELLNDIGASVGDNGRFELTRIFLGGNVISGVCTELHGYKAEAACKTGFILGSGELLDINDLALHKGKKTRSQTDVKGVLYGNAKKTFRGTIDFRNGSSGAVGAETEDVLLMDETVVNKTVPVILCAEEDVEGSHGASIGRLSEDILYYMTSRGISLEEAYKLTAASRLETLIAGIGDERTEERARAALERRWSNAGL